MLKIPIFLFTVCNDIGIGSVKCRNIGIGIFGEFLFRSITSTHTLKHLQFINRSNKDHAA